MFLRFLTLVSSMPIWIKYDLEKRKKQKRFTSESLKLGPKLCTHSTLYSMLLPFGLQMLVFR